MNGQARFGGKTLIANNSGNITFNGATKTATDSDTLKVVSQGNITFNGASNTRGDFLSKGTFNANGASFIFGTIDAKQSITFNGGAYVTAVSTIVPNSAPTDLTLSNNTTPENVPTNSLIGNFNSIDPDSGNIFAYSLTTGTGSTDNSLFSIANNELRIINSPNFETKNLYTLRVRTTDQGGLFYEKALTVNITDVNEAPISLTLSNNITSENVAANSLIGTFTSTDSDTTPQTLTYSLITGTGSTDNSAFTVINNELHIVNLPNFEAKNSYNIRVRSTDQGGLFYDKAFAIGISDINETPTDLVLSNSLSLENVAANSLIGTFTSSDPDTTAQIFTYSLATGTGSSDNSSFSIINNELRIINSPDFEVKNSYSIRVKTTDQGGLSYEKAFTIAITNINEAPIFTSTSTTIQNTSQPYQYNITTTDPENNTLNITATNLPTWLTLIDNQNGTAQLTGNPSLAPSGIYNIQLTAKEANTPERLETNQNLAIAVDNTPPAIAIQLQQDTGISSTDKITNNPAIIGTVTDAGTVIGTITELKAGFGGTANINIFDTFSNGTFNLDQNRLNLIAGTTLSNGTKTLTISAKDNSGNISTQDFAFTLDTSAPQTPGFTLDSAFDTAPIGDSQTTFTNVKLVGLTEANATVTLATTAIKTDGVGRFVFSNIALNLGDNTFTVNAQDLAGNTSIFTTNIKRVAQDNSDVVLDWNATLLNAIAVERSAPPVASRNMAIVQTAVFDTINSFTNTYNSYHFAGTAPTGASIEAAAASAAYRTLINLYPNQASFLNSALVTSLAKIPDGIAEDTGVAFGRTVAEDILAFRSTDGSSDPTVYTPTNNPGDWQPTAPSFGLALLPKWGEVTPFGLTSGSQFRPGGEPDLTSDRYTSDFNQIKEIGKIDSTTRTADQTEIAKFWADGAGTYTPPGHWNQIAQNVVANQGNSLLQNARLFALLDIGLADAGIAAWDAKYTYATWRPITAIQKADTDGNPNTTADPNWRPLIITPPFPEYISGHSTFSGAADSILTGLLGNNVSFTTNSLGTLGVYRSFGNFASAADEAGISRIYGGIHFGFSNVDGLATGRSVGNYVLQNLLTPISTFSLSNSTTPENVPANSVIGSFTSNNSQSSSYSLVSGTGDADNSAFSIINNELRILSSPDFETKNSYSIRVRTTDPNGVSSEKTFAIAILDLNEGANPAIAIQLQQDTGISSTDKITNNPNLTGRVTVNGTIIELKAGFTNTPTFNILPTFSNGNFTLDQNLLNQIAGSTLTDGQKVITITAKSNSGNQSTQNLSFTLDTSAPKIPTLILDPAYDTAPVGDSQTTSTNVKLTGKTEANITVALSKQSPIPSPTSIINVDSTGNFAFTDVPLDLGNNFFAVYAQDLAGNISDFNTNIKRIAIEPDVTQLNIKPGEQLKLESMDIFSSLGIVGAKFSLESAREMPTGMLEGDGTLILKPSPDQLGNYEFSLIARDGDGIFIKKYILNVVPDSDTSTRISGVIKSTDQTPLAGIAVRIGNFVATTAADGSFTITLPEPPAEGTAMIIQPDQEAEGIIYPSIAEKLPLVLEHDVYANANNIIYRPIYLPPIDIANAVTINPTVNQTVTSAAIAGSAVFVAANSLFDQEGNPYTGKLSITTVPRDFTPAALPENLYPDLVVTIQPGEMRFSTPAPLSLPNLAGYAAGTLMDLWSINPVTGFFDNVGTGQVSVDGSVINTISGGIRNSSWHFFSPPPVPISPTSGSTPNGNQGPSSNPTPDPFCGSACKPTAKTNSNVELGSGAEIETHDLVSYQSLGQTRSLQLVYNSNYANPRPIIHSTFNGSLLADNASFYSLVSELTLKRGNFSFEVSGNPDKKFGLSGGENFWRFNGTTTADIALQADLREGASGIYQYEMRSGVLIIPDITRSIGSLSTITGDVLVINKIKSNFGSGWGLSSLQEIVVNPDRSVLIIDDAGNNRIFKYSDSGYISSPGDMSKLERLADGTFKLTSHDQTVSQFDAENHLVSVTDRMGNRTRHIYTAQGISKIIDPTGLETSFTYNANGKVNSITDPSGKVTTMDYNSAGDLVRVTDPNSTSRNWQYNSNHAMLSEVDQQGASESVTYDAFGRLISATMKDGSTVSINPLETNGLISPTLTSRFETAPIASTTRSNVVYTDGRGNKTTTTLDNRQQAISVKDEVSTIRDAFNTLSTTTRKTASNLVVSTTNGRGILTSYTYDSMGNVLTSTTLDGTRTYTYETIFNQVTSETDELERITLYDINPLTGDVMSINRVVGAVGGDDDLITSYTYTPQGLQDTIIDPLGHITDYDYDIYGNTIKITFAKGTADQASQQFEYDLAGNQTASIDELGRRTEYRYDLANQLIETIYPDNTPLTLLDNPRTRTEYDVMGNQTATIDELGRQTTFIYNQLGRLLRMTEPDPDGAGALLSPVTQYEYDANGNQTAVIDQLGRRTEYQYDARNRLIKTIYPDGTKEVPSYDFDNNLTSSKDAKGNLTTREYDRLGRLTRIYEPNASSSFEYDKANQLIAQTDANSNRTQYVYDELGRRISTIDALGNSSFTSYDKNGNIIAETDELNRTTTYVYDNRDRQVSITTPLNFTSLTAYDSDGKVDLSIDPLGQVTDYDYDAQGRTVKIIFAKGTIDQASQQFEYDLAGNQTVSVDELGRRTEYKYDNQNRLIETIYPDNTPLTLADNPRMQSEYDARGNQIATIDELGRRTNLIYNLQDRLVKTVKPDPDGTGVLLSPEISYQYDANGNQTEVIDQLGRKTQYQYDVSNRLIATIYPDGNRETSTYDANNNLISSTNANGNITTREYDATNKLVKLNEHNGSTIFEYDKANQLIAQADANGDRTQYVYDELGRKVKTIDALGGVSLTSYDKNGNVIAETDELNRITTYSYDQRDRQTIITFAKNTVSEAAQKIEYDLAGNQTASIDELGRRTEYRYDSQNRLIETIYPDNTPLTLLDNPNTKTEYDLRGNQIASIDELGRRTEFIYDRLDRLLKMTEPDPDGAGVLLAPETRYEYDALGNKTAVIDQLGRKTEYQYDNRVRIIATIYPDLSRETFTYDANGNLIDSFDANGNRITREYDSSDRLIKTSKLVGYTNSPNGSKNYQYDDAYFQYDRANQLISQTDGNSNRTEYVYDRLGRRTHTINAQGNISTTSYDKSGNITAEIDQLNRTTTYGYDDRNRKTSTTTALGFTSLTNYDSVGNVVSATDANNHTTSYIYDPRNRKTEVKDALNQSAKITYDAVGNVIATTNQLNQTSTYLFDNLNRQIESIDLLNQISKTEYDGFGNVIAVINPLGQRTSYSYDAKNRRNSVTDALGKVTQTAYDRLGNVLSITDPENNVTAYEYQVVPNGKKIKIKINGSLPAISSDGRYVALGIDSSLDSKDTNSTSDIFRLDNQTGELIRVSTTPTGAAPNGASFNISISGDGHYVAFHSTSTNIDGNPSGGLFVRDLQAGTTTRIASPIGNSNQELNDFNKSFTISENGEYIAFTSSESDLVQDDTNGVPDVFIKNLQTEDVERVSISTNGDQSNGNPDQFAFLDISENGRYVAFSSEATNLVNNDTNNATDIFVRDRLLGKTTRVSVDSSGNQANGRSYYHSISADGRYVAFTSEAPNLSGSNGAFVFVHDLQTGVTTKIGQGFAPSINSDGRFVTFSNGDIFLYDIANSSLKTISSGGGVFSRISDDGQAIAFSKDSTDVFVYDASTNLATSIGDRFDEPAVTNRLAGEINANGDQRKYNYDNIGNITSITDRDGTTQRYTYDRLNRRTKEEWLDLDNNLIRTIANTYNAAGELTQISDPDSTYRYTYDLDGRVLSISNEGTSGVPTTIMTYTYDKVGNTKFITENINGTPTNTTSQQYDALNRLTQNIQGSKRIDYIYNALGQVTNKKRYADIQGTMFVAETNHTYDSLNHLTNITHSKGANTIASYTQSYDAGSKITGITSTDGNSTFNYDDTDQLTGADYNYQTDENYTYDANGNRTNTGYVTGINNQLLEDSKYRYEYDKVGNRTKRTDKSTNEVTEYSWDIRDRLTGIRVTNALGDVIRTANYVYDVYDQRNAKIVDLDGDGLGAATTERFVYGSNQNIALVFDGNGTLTHRYMFSNGIDQIEADEQLATGTTLWALTDHLGSVRDIVDNSGTVQNHIIYDAFGNITSQSNSSVIFRYGYTAREFDSESGLQYNRARYVDTFTGKFISEDKIGFAAGDTNLNRYVFNQPITRTDPSGFESRELTALFLNSSKPLNVRTNTVLTYNTKFSKISEAYAYAAVWFDAITTGLLGSSNKNPLGEIVFRALKDDTGKLEPPVAGKATLRPFSRNQKGPTQGKPQPTIDLTEDTFERRHGTPNYLIINEVKFSYEDKDKDPKDCSYLPKNVLEEEEREKARIAVGNIIAASPQRQRTPESQPQQNFTPPNIDFGELGRGILGIPGVIREFFRDKV